MLGKTNLLFVAEDEQLDLSFNPQYILTSSSSDILKIEYINNLFFAYTGDDKVLYGSDINNLQTLKKDGSPFPATYIIYKNNAYYMIVKEQSTEKVVVYKTTNLSTFEEITIRNASSETIGAVTLTAGALLLTSDNRIAMLYTIKTSNYTHTRLVIVDTLEGFSHGADNFIELNTYIETGCDKTYMLKDRIVNMYSVDNTYIITLDGTVKSALPFTTYAAGYFFYTASYRDIGTMSSNSKLAVYYSLNGVDYQAVHLDISTYSNNVLTETKFFEYDGNIVMYYPDKIAITSTPKGLVEATKNAIPVEMDYKIKTVVSLYKDDYVYLGGTGGIIIKAKLDYTDTTRPDITLLKILSAKQALAEAKRYTDEKIAALEARVKTLEEKNT